MSNGETDKAVCSWLCNKVKADVELGPRTWGWAAEHPPGAPSAAWAVQSLSGTWADSPKSSYLTGGWNDSNAVYKCRRLSQRQQTKQGERNKTQARHPSLSKHAAQKGKRWMPYFKNSYVGNFCCFWAASHPEEHREAAALPQVPSSVVASGDAQPGSGRQLTQSPSLAEHWSLSFAFSLHL